MWLKLPLAVPVEGGPPGRFPDKITRTTWQDTWEVDHLEGSDHAGCGHSGNRGVSQVCQRTVAGKIPKIKAG